ncbi:hypothetical protein GCM10023081_32670 [Arthrobacter ginkgonis]|uniref:Bacterial Ig-like domain-containing protein n=1 Tax=Arthrobacter ginkgonis TaxID=1630594 RepID=A0ABP7CLE5_9MICC
MQRIALPALRFRHSFVLVVVLALVATLSLVSAPSSLAAAKRVDERVETSIIHSGLDEPSWAYVGNPVEILASLGAEDESGPAPTGTLRFTFHNGGIAPLEWRLDGREWQTYFRTYITPKRIGKHRYTVSYSGDKNYQPVSRSFGFEVWTGPDTKTSLKVNKRTVTVSEPVTLRALVTTASGRPQTGYADGAVQFYANGEWIGEGVSRSGPGGWDASLSVGYLPVGTHKIVAVFEPILHYDLSRSEPFVVTVKPAAKAQEATGSLTTDRSDPNYPRTVASVRAAKPGGPTPTGYVQFYSGEYKLELPVKLVDGMATSPYGWGARIYAKYLGDTRYAPATLRAAVPSS